MTYEEMTAKTNAQLVDYHNELAARLDGVKPLENWKQAKDKLIDRIVPLEEQVADLDEAEDDALTSVTVNNETFEQVDPENLDDNGEPLETREVSDDDEPKRTIKAASVDLLCHVAYYEDRDEKSGDENRVDEDHPKARSVGLAYDEIIARIQEEFPGCNTSVACLRWYSVKIRVEEHGYEGLRLPQRRPRAKPKTAS